MIFIHKHSLIFLAMCLIFSAQAVSAQESESAGFEQGVEKELKPEIPVESKRAGAEKGGDSSAAGALAGNPKGPVAEEELPENYWADEETEQRAETGSQVDVGGLAFRMVSYLFLFLALIVLLLYCLRRFKPASRAIYGNPAVRVLGRTPLWGKSNMFLVKVGASRVLLLSATMDKVEVLCEITDKNEISELTLMAEPDKDHSFFDKMLKKASLLYETDSGTSEKKSLDKIDAQVDKMKDKVERFRRENR